MLEKINFTLLLLTTSILWLRKHPSVIFLLRTTWLTKVFLGNLKIYRQDRSDGYDGFFFACQEMLISEEKATICSEATMIILASLIIACS